MTGKIECLGNIQSLLNYSKLCKQCCYYGLFKDCESLIKAPELPSINLAKDCYVYMFSGCKSLQKSPNLNATFIPFGAYSFMFHNCKSLINVSDLPATTVNSYGYYAMFIGCEALTKLPKLALINPLGNSNCGWMFGSCNALIDARIDLLSLNLTPSCYGSMFAQSLNIVYGPKIYANSINSESCIRNMFYNCRKLQTLEVNFTSWNNEYSQEWLYLTALNTTGTFMCPSSLVIPSRDKHGVPENWNIVRK